jgi:hypothetical protein
LLEFVAPNSAISWALCLAIENRKLRLDPRALANVTATFEAPAIFPSAPMIGETVSDAFAFEALDTLALRQQFPVGDLAHTLERELPIAD